jgi:hypothetical protein
MVTRTCDAPEQEQARVDSAPRWPSRRDPASSRTHAASALSFLSQLPQEVAGRTLRPAPEPCDGRVTEALRRCRSHGDGRCPSHARSAGPPPCLPSRTVLHQVLTVGQHAVTVACPRHRKAGPRGAGVTTILGARRNRPSLSIGRSASRRSSQSRWRVACHSCCPRWFTSGVLILFLKRVSRPRQREGPCGYGTIAPMRETLNDERETDVLICER